MGSALSNKDCLQRTQSNEHEMLLLCVHLARHRAWCSWGLGVLNITVTVCAQEKAGAQDWDHPTLAATQQQQRWGKELWSVSHSKQITPAATVLCFITILKALYLHGCKQPPPAGAAGQGTGQHHQPQSWKQPQLCPHHCPSCPGISPFFQ